MAKSPEHRTKLIAPKRNFSKKKNESLVAAKKQQKSKAGLKNPTQKKETLGNFITYFLRYIIRLILKVFWWLTLRFVIVLVFVLSTATLFYFGKLPDANVLMDDRLKGSVTMLDSRGEVFAWRGDQFGGRVTSKTVSPHLKNAIIATEDKRFYRHWGISPRGIIGAIRINLREGRKAWKGNGGSTITQQLAKRIYFEGLGGLERKIKEVPMSMAMEIKYTKNEILTIYLNRAFLGSGAYGFEAASQRYFGKSARNVNPAEAAMLAGLLKAPSAANPIRNLDRAQSRGNLIISLMESQGYLTQAQARQAKNNPAELSQIAADKAGGYFADWVLGAAPEFIIKDANADVIIKTTFDKGIQKDAEEALEIIFQKLKVGSNVQAAILVMSKDGAVRAMVGGRKTALAGSFNRATQALRQTGSAFKPFVYAAALENGYRFNDILRDEPILITDPSGEYKPQNYNRIFEGNVSLTHALAKSTNTVAIKLSEEVGRARVKAIATDFGITTDIPLVASMALGTSESTLLEMTGAYAGILNQGIVAKPYGLKALTIQGEKTPLLEHDSSEGFRVINENAASQLTFMMNQVIKVGTGRRANLEGRQAAGKTGTTQGARDAWFIGFTADYVTGVWMGYDDNRKLSGVTGGGLPADIWRETMLRVHEGLPLKPLFMNSSESIKLFAPINALGGTQIKSIFKSIKKEIRKIEKPKSEIKSIFKNIFSKN